MCMHYAFCQDNPHSDTNDTLPASVPAPVPAPVQRICTYCGGKGTQRCHLCNGLGICIGCHGRGNLGSTIFGPSKIIICPNCSGSGKCRICEGRREEVCDFCYGSGVEHW